MLAARNSVLWFGVVAALSWHGSARSAPATADRDSFEAREFERKGQWERACDVYLRLLADDRQQSDLRERLGHCLRRWQQARRLADEHYRHHVAAMPLSQSLTTYSEVISLLQRYYVEPARVDAGRLWRAGLEEIRNALSDPSFVAEQLAGIAASEVADFRARLEREIQSPVPDVRELRSALRGLAWDAHQRLGVNPSVIVLEAACGACQSGDDYTSFVPPGRTVLETAHWNGELAAFGITVTARDGLVVERVAPGSWAASQGMQAGDRIVRVGKNSLEKLTAEAALEMIRGERQVLASLTIAGGGMAEPRTIALPESLPSVFDVAMERDGVGTIRLGSFQRTTLQEFDSAVLRLRAEGMRALILDLRGNPGGSFVAAVQIAERFIGDGVIVSTQGQLRGLSRLFRAQNAAALDVPVVVLVDGDTASAAEVLAGALKDNHRAILVGQPTFGKDTIQQWWHTSAGGAVQLTLARFLLPGGRTFAGVGVSPNFVENRRDPMRDFQFEAALEHATRLAALR